jgi:hypothetical protein
MIKRLVVSATVVVACLAFAATGSAQTRSWSYTFNPNNSALSFQPPPPLPLITFTAGYDNTAGTLTISESGGDPSYYDYWQDDTWAFYPAGHTSLSGSAPSGSIFWEAGGFGNPPGSSYFGPLTVTGINGSLQAANTVDGTTITATYSSPLLKGLNWVAAGIGGDGSGGDNTCLCDLMPSYSAYFAGYLPSIALDVGNRTSKLGAHIDTTFNPRLEGPASLDGDITPTVTSVHGLPGGLRFANVDNGDGTTSPTISGTTTTPGVYHVVITTRAAVAGGSQTVTGTGGFIWTIQPPTVKLPSNDGATTTTGLEVKPYSIVDSGDGSSLIAGTPLHRGSSTDRHFGRIRWTRWSYANGANGTGTLWLDNCNPACAGGTFFGYPVTLHAYRPARIAGQWIFSRITMTFTQNRPRLGRDKFARTQTLTVRYSFGSYYFAWTLRD